MSEIEAEIVGDEVVATVHGKQIKTSKGLAAVAIGLEQLRYYHRTGSSSKPVELAWEIRVYEWILAQPDAEEKARQYAETRMPSNSYAPPRSKREVIKELGWVIP